MLFALGFIAQFTIGGLSGVLHSIVPADTQQTDTYFVVAHFHYVLFGGLVFGIFGGFYYWYPKAYGRYMNERLGKLNFWTMVIGFNLTFFPMHLLGLWGMPRRTYRYDTGLGWQSLNLLATIGAFIIALSVLIFIVNLITSRFRGDLAPADAWDGRTLEWSIPSPPPEYNFAEIPDVEARDDFWHRKYTEDEEGRLLPLPSGGSDDAPTAVATHDASPDGHGGHGIHMPSPSYFPLIVALGLPVIGYGAVFKTFWLLIPGAIVVLFGIYAWFIEPGTAPD
jgi:cytochrome c oxidase subunit 1